MAHTPTPSPDRLDPAVKPRRGPWQDLLDDAGQIRADVLCTHCAYNLRTQPPTAPCPECATPVQISLRDFMRDLQEHAWLEEICRGAYCVVAVILLIDVLFLLNHLPPNLFAIVIVGLMTFVCFILSAWYLSTPPPSPDAVVPFWRDNICRWIFLAAWPALFLFMLPASRRDAPALAAFCTFHLLGLSGVLFRLAALAQRRRLPALRLLTLLTWTLLWPLLLLLIYWALPMPYRIIGPIPEFLAEHMQHLSAAYVLLLGLTLVAWALCLRPVIRTTRQLRAELGITF